MTAPFIVGLDRRSMFEVLPTAESAEREYFDTRAARALHGTASGESMATWGAHYIRHARAMTKGITGLRGQLWERLAEGVTAAQARYNAGEGFCPDCTNAGDHSRTCPQYRAEGVTA